MVQGTIAVFGSLNVDLVTRLDRVPGPGETVAARDFAIVPGGKGANQAVAGGKLGAEVRMFGLVGTDPLAERLYASLDAAGVDRAAVETVAGVATGTASIWVEPSGENRIAIAAGANGRLDARYVDAHLASLTTASYLLLQLEVPAATNRHLLASLPERGGPRVILDPAPALPLAELPCERVWMLTPNEHELATLSGMPVASEEEVRVAAAWLRERTGATIVLVKAGARGAFLSEPGGFRRVPGFEVGAVDTTAAGDAFNGALAAALSRQGTGESKLASAVAYAHAAAALSTTRAGAQPALPGSDEVEAFLTDRGLEHGGLT